jgi:predicted MarR family transcription regulator
MKTKSKMGRPKLPKNELLAETIRVRVSSPELADIESAVKSADEGFSEWARKKLVAAARRA